jgi:dTDP-4-amino-4,6-dideoxygalactose transaminase
MNLPVELTAKREPADHTRKSPAVTDQSVPFNDLSVQWREIADEVRRDFEGVFATSAFCLGPHVEAFEREVAAYLGVPHAIGVNSGTSALHLAVLAANLGPGDEVLVPAHTFIATLWAPIYAGATPVLCDVDEATGNIDVADAERRLSSRTRAILPVHLYGQAVDMDAVNACAARHNLMVIEDCAQAIGAKWRDRSVGSLGFAGCFSFYPGKNLGAAGEAGLVVTSDDNAAALMRSLRNHGQRERYVHTTVGYNYRMDGLQGVVLRHKLRRLDMWTGRRRELAQRYLSRLSGLSALRLPVPQADHVWHLFVIRTPKRDALRDYLKEHGIESGLHYPIGNHRQPCLAHLQLDRGSFPRSDNWANEGLSLPLFYGMTDAQVDKTAAVVLDFLARG